MDLVALKARAYVNRGRWVADCPNAYCWNALALTPRQEVFHCLTPSGADCCRGLYEIEWPADADEISQELSRRPNDVNRNWYPADHDLAVRANIPHGQTVAELRDETEEGLRAEAAARAAAQILNTPRDVTPGQTEIPLNRLIGEGEDL